MTHVDLHLHGAFGIDVVTAGPAELERLSVRLASHGYSAFLPTLVPLPLDRLEPALERLAAWIGTHAERDTLRAQPLGVHFEGPFVSPHRAGALHEDAFLDGRDEAAVERFFRMVANVPGRHMTTLAPEIPGGLELIGEFRKRGFLVSLGHTDADWGTLEHAVRAGARHMTHFCNAMRPLHHRDPGPIGFGLACRDVTLDVIADLVHLDARMLQLVFAVRGTDAVALISDAIPAAGLGDGEHEAWGETLHVKEGIARNRAGALAGSVALLGQGVENVASLGIPRRAAEVCASELPLHILMGARVGT